MGKFVVDLSPEHRAMLEAIRAERGLRSEADAVRDLIEGASERLQSPADLAANRAYAAAASERVVNVRAAPAKPAPRVRETAPSAGSVPLAGTFERKPYQKGTKK